VRAARLLAIGRRELHDRTRAFDAGFDGYVEKPISVRALPQQVSDFLKLGGTS
jgi:two-component system cell cycle response regulator DivK